MTWELILKILTAVGTIGFGFLSAYLKSNAKAKEKFAQTQKQVLETKEEITKRTTEFITDAEKRYIDATKAGGKKFEWAVNGLYDLVPDTLQAFITKEFIENLVEDVFDKTEEYAKTQLDKVVDKIVDKK